MRKSINKKITKRKGIERTSKAYFAPPAFFAPPASLHTNPTVFESVFLTKNSVYAIHDVSKLREKRLNDLGIS